MVWEALADQPRLFAPGSERWESFDRNRSWAGSKNAELVNYSAAARGFVESSGAIWMTRSQVGADTSRPLCRDQWRSPRSRLHRTNPAMEAG